MPDRGDLLRSSDSGRQTCVSERREARWAGPLGSWPVERCARKDPALQTGAIEARLIQRSRQANDGEAEASAVSLFFSPIGSAKRKL
jgi:hypothetical protein